MVKMLENALKYALEQDDVTLALSNVAALVRWAWYDSKIEKVDVILFQDLINKNLPK